MPIKTITQIRADTPTVVLTDSDLLLVDQAAKTVAATMAQIKAHVRPAAATTGVDGLMTAADKTKLTGIAAAATANQTDTYLLSRTNHTGTQPIATVTGLQDALDAKANSGAIPDISWLPDYVEGVDAELLELGGDVTALETGKLNTNNPAPTGGFTFPGYTFAGKPDATTNSGRYIEITNALGGITLCRSNGTDWMVVAVVSADVAEAAP